MLNEKLRSEQYYLDKLSLFLKNSYGIKEQVRLLWELLTDMATSIDDVFNALRLEDDIDVDDTLDVLAEIVGCRRDLDVEVIHEGLTINKTIHLTNKELIRFIKTKIIQNNYSGSYIDFVDNYNSISLEVITLDDANVSGLSQQILNAGADIDSDDASGISSNDKYMFLSGNYSIKSVGITYDFSVGELELIAIWDSSLRRWDHAQWGN